MIVLSEESPDSVDIRLSNEEMWMLNGALNEVCNGVIDLADDGEFQTRLGWERSELLVLLREIHSTLRKVD